MHVTGDQFIRTLAAYMRSHESTWSHHPAIAAATTTLPTSTTSLLVSWLGYNSNSNNNGPSNSDGNTPNSNSNHTPFIVDPWHLFYLNARFEELGLTLLECEDDVIDSVVEARGQMTRLSTTNHQSHTASANSSAAVASLQRAVKPPSIVSVASQRSVASTAMTLLTGFARWSATGSNSQKANEAPHTTVEEDVRFIHQCMQYIAAVRIGPFGKRRILDADDGTDRPNGIQVSLDAFSNVRQLEVIKISPLALTGWMRLQSQLERVGCRGRLGRVEDLLLKTLQLEMQQRILAERLSSSTTNDSNDDQQQQQPPPQYNTELLEELEALCQLSPLEVWPRLVALDLTGNALADIPDNPFIYARHCMELNLSRNILTSVPRSLKDLAQLRSLDLSHNKIDSLTNIGEILPTLVHLSLASNRLRSIIGVEQLSRLERLDLSNNQIQDPQEISRLSGLLHLSHLQVEGNPLVKIPQYRITIFSLLYGGAQLYLDNSLPTFMERRQIKNRPADATEAIPAAVVSTQINHSKNTTAVASPKAKPRRKPTRLVALSQQEFVSRRESEEMKGLNILGSPIRPRADSFDTLNSEWRQSRDLTGTSLSLDGDRWESLEANRASSTSTANTEWTHDSNTSNTSQHQHHRCKSTPLSDDHNDMQVTAMSDSMLMIGHPTESASEAADTISNMPNDYHHRNGVNSSRRVHRVIGLEASVSEGLANRTSDSSNGSNGTPTPRTRQRRATTDNISAVLSAGPNPMSQRQASHPRPGLSSPPVGLPGDDYRRRIEAMRNEAGSTWLRVYNEIQYRDRSSMSPNARRRESTDPHTTNANTATGRDDQFPIGSSVTSKPMITLAAIRASRLQQQQQQHQQQTQDANRHTPLNEAEIRDRRLSKDDLQLTDSLVSTALLSADSTDMKRSFSDSHRPTSMTNLSATPVKKTPNLKSDKSTLNTPTIIAQVQETTAKLHRRAARAPFETRQLIIDSNSSSNSEGEKEEGEEEGQHSILMEMNLETQQIMARRPLNTLIYAAHVGVDRTGAALLQLRFKSSRHDPVLTVRYRIQDVKAADQLMTLFDTTRKTNWEQGHVHRVCKQSKCLSCQWTGIHQHELTGAAGQSVDLAANDEAKRMPGTVEDKQCPQCHSNFLVDFFDHSTPTDNKTKDTATNTKEIASSSHKEDTTNTDTDTTTATSSTHRTINTSANDPGLLSSWMSSVSPSWPKMDMLLGLGGNTSNSTESETAQNGVATSTGALPSTSAPTSRLSGWSRVAGRVSEVAAVPHENPFASLLGYQPVLPPYQTNTNSLRLHFHLSVFEDDNENLLAWVPCSFIVQAPSKVTTSSNSTSARWTRVRTGESTNNVPNHCPVERPIYLALSTRAVYLVELTRPLTGGVAVVAAAASIYNPFSWQRDTTTSPQNNGPPKLAPNSLGVTNKVAESRPEQYLRILRKLTLNQLTRIDVGPRNQFITFHLQRPTTTTTTATVAATSATDASSTMEDQRPVTLFIRDMERCAEVLDLLEHKMEWPSNITSSSSSTNYAQLIRRDTQLWRDCLTRTTWTSSESAGLTVAIEENTIAALPDPIWLTAWVCTDEKCIRSCTLSATLQNLYITTERFDVWPPSVDDVHEILDKYHDTPVQGDAMATVIPRYKFIRKISLLHMTKLAYARVGWSAALVDEQAHEGYTAASWSCSVRIDFRLDTEDGTETTESQQQQQQQHWTFLFHTRDEATHCVETLSRLYHIAQQQQLTSASSSGQTFSGNVETLLVVEDESASSSASIDVKQEHRTITGSPTMGAIDMQRVPSIQEAIEPEDV